MEKKAARAKRDGLGKRWTQLLKRVSKEDKLHGSDGSVLDSFQKYKAHILSWAHRYL